MTLRLLFAGLLALSLVACGTPQRVALDATTKQTIQQINVSNIVGQDEIIVRAEAYGASAALGGGLIGALIDSKVAESRQNTIQGTLNPFYASVDDFDFRGELQNALTTALQQGSPIKVTAVEMAYLSKPDVTAARRVALGASGGLLELGTAYTFSPDFKRFMASTRASMQLPGKEQPVYLNTFFYESPAVGSGGASSLQEWAANQGAQYRTSARDAIAQLIAMLKLDLMSGATDPASAAKASVTLAAPPNMVITGAVLETSVDRTIVRAANGNLYSTKQSTKQ